MYVDAIYSKKTSEILVVERNQKGEREFKQYPAKHVFYYSDSKGKHKTIFGNTVSKYETTDEAKFKKELNILRDGKRIYESDINPVFRCLEENYSGAESPNLHISIIDIEVNFNPEKGFASPEKPYAEINAITVHHNWTDELHTLALKPEAMTEAQAKEVVRKFSNTTLFLKEADLLKQFLQLIDDTDVLSGWNSEFFDIPYIVERIKIALGRDYTKKMCLWGEEPKQRAIDKFGKTQIAYDLVGCISIDYLDLFKKHSLQQYHSYRLDFIGEQEVGEKKIAYDGTLDQLYKKDFYKFIEYNRQDVALLVKIDKKNKFIDLANQIAHTNCVLLKTTMGAVALIDQAIVNEAHRRGMIVQDKPRNQDTDEMGAAGAYVADPKIGLHEDVGAVDINSLYPSVIRSLNMCTETLVGQIEQTETKRAILEKINQGQSPADAWHGMFGSIEYEAIFNRREDFDVCLNIGNTNDQIKKRYASAAEVYDFIFDPANNLCISANGTIFKTDVEGVIPGLLTKWYSERKQMQGYKKDFEKRAKEATDSKEKKEYEETAAFWDKRQYVRKILLNSLYGALLNVSSRFYDQRIGQSVTLTGRCITRHMISEINQSLTGDYNHLGEAIVYGDSVSGDTVVNVSINGEEKELNIEELFLNTDFNFTSVDENGNTRRSMHPLLKTNTKIEILTYNPETKVQYYAEVDYVKQHNTNKEKYLIEDGFGNSIIVTGDHSIMVERNGDLIEVKPNDILDDDLIVTKD